MRSCYLQVKEPLLEGCKELAKSLGVEQMVDFLGFRNDIPEILPMCDVAVASSLREGLPVNIYGSDGLWVACNCNRESGTSGVGHKSKKWLDYKPS